MVFLWGCQRDISAPVQEADREQKESEAEPVTRGYTGSVSCRECHERFYELWVPSHHGLAMQPYTQELARTRLTPQEADIAIKGFRYRAEIGEGHGWVKESGPDGEQRYPMVHAMGGKNVYYFLTPMEKGRLQTLPVAYDVHRKEWFDTAASGVRHFPGGAEDEPLNWKEWPYTFNTACHSCHVSQLSTNYDPGNDTYTTTWAEPGINCEACHGPGEEHVRVCREAGKGEVPRDLKTRVITPRHGYSSEQVNAACAPCHTKGAPVSPSFQPGERYFDHYDLVALEHPDFHPDGRDLGENYTYTLWLMSPCVKSGELHCLHCHTSSGRFRQKEDPDQACMPCHAERVKNAAVHTRHPPDKPGSRCIHCHMPMTEFARMRRSDHSMLPPTPAATLAFDSPNACNICHKDKDATWADDLVRKWHKRDYQAPVLHRAGLIDAARKQDWERLPDILCYLKNPVRDEVVAASLIRLLSACEDERVRPMLLQAMKDPSPLVRSAAVSSLTAMPFPEAFKPLLETVDDDYRLVRIRAAMALAPFSGGFLNQVKKGDLVKLEMASKEFLASLTSRLDQWTSHYNMGNFHMSRGDYGLALASYEAAIRLDPGNTVPLVNASLAYARSGKSRKAEESLEKALAIDPGNATAHFNMGLLKAEQHDLRSAEAHLRAARKADPGMAEAAYNLGVLIAQSRREESLELLAKAFKLRSSPKHGYTLAFYARETGDLVRATEVLSMVVKKWPTCTDAYLLLGDIHEAEGRSEDASSVYGTAVERCRLSPEHRTYLKGKIQEMQKKLRNDSHDK